MVPSPPAIMSTFASSNHLHYCRTSKSGAKPCAEHPPTSKPQTCRTCALALPAAHFSLDGRRSIGRASQCRACTAADKARHLAVFQPGELAESKECLLCRQTLPAAAFTPARQGTGGLASYCRMCYTKRQREQRKARLPSPQPLPETAVCSVCHHLKPLAAFNRRVGSTFGVQHDCADCKTLYTQRRRAAAAAASDGSGRSPADVGDGQPEAS